MSEISETVIFNKSIAKSTSGTLKKKIPWNCYITRIQYFFARNQQNLLHVDVRVKDVSVAKYEDETRKYVMGDDFPVDVLCFFEVEAEEELQCWYSNTDADDVKTLFVIVHLLRKVPKEEIKGVRWWW